MHQLSFCRQNPGRDPGPAAAAGPGSGRDRGRDRLVGVVPVPSCGNWENVRENMLVPGQERGLEARPWEQGEVLGAPLGLHHAPSIGSPRAFVIAANGIDTKGDAINRAWGQGLPGLKSCTLCTPLSLCTSLLFFCSNSHFPP